MDKLTPRKSQILSSSFEDTHCLCDLDQVREEMQGILQAIEKVQASLQGSNNVVALRELHELKKKAASLGAIIED